MKTDQRAKANSQSSGPVTQFYPLPSLSFNSFGVDSEDECIGVFLTNRRGKLGNSLLLQRQLCGRWKWACGWNRRRQS